MARYRDIDMSARLLPVSLEAQIVPGSFAHAVYHLVGELDLSRFDAHYRNDDNGAPAHSPAMLLRAVLLAWKVFAERRDELSKQEPGAIHPWENNKSWHSRPGF